MRIDSVEESLFPQITKLVALLDIAGNLLVIARAMNFGAPISLYQPARLVELGRIQEIRRVSRYQHLTATCSIHAEFFRKFGHELRVKLVFRFFDAK
ncbi:hypothetical protein DXO170_06790 [Xanthomonas oryzae pv. oryzae]|uniref:Uncharacterized protein n=1 Tax=Xanthomonas oryzae pv. oryzae TaxID=64187 RepID=A0A854CJN7_XANOO|nr:hypothetical protein BO993_05045 [Xanthomonas oryzae pv. oryzae]OLG32210.1 hypothetical protein BXO2_16790 [Xanthomonas oryzae pv. oryzae]OLG41791.1 hypothetical protein BXO25_19370 [Xanthomonas oryzae pv. oryzae]OLG48086.1 hypothetical protein BXO33_03850 [Xanthomonas oryzae pv. oryzae]OLG57398.1 hypothetical protein BXO34_00345 [Xanthomonas oryzae pv. oryzae]